MTRSKRFVIRIAAVLALMPMAASGADSVPGGDTQVATAITPETPYSAADVLQRASDLGISTKEAELRIRLERASVGFEPKLLEAFPTTFGGVWLEVEGPPGLTVALTGSVEEALPTIQSMFPIPAAVRTVGVEHALVELLALRNA